MATNVNFSEKEKVEAYYEKNHWKITFKRMLKDWRLYVMLIPRLRHFIISAFPPQNGHGFSLISAIFSTPIPSPFASSAVPRPLSRVCGRMPLSAVHHRWRNCRRICPSYANKARFCF